MSRIISDLKKRLDIGFTTEDDTCCNPSKHQVEVLNLVAIADVLIAVALSALLWWSRRERVEKKRSTDYPLMDGLFGFA